MCGIAGFSGFKDDKLIRDFSLWLKHRGPDGDGYFLNDSVSLLNRRLAIIDVKGGDQPIYNEDKSIAVVYNGEIYNYLDLRRELEAKGHVFSTKSDTEVIVHGYEEWGFACFDRFNGMFGVALYDAKNKRTVLARDHFGIKPLYFACPSDGQVMFSSEIKPLIKSGRIPVEPDDRTVYRYLKYRIHDEGRHTFFKGIHRLLPGEYMVIENGGHRIESYTRLKQELFEKSAKSAGSYNAESVNAFRDLLIDSIRLRLVSEVPVGTCLSGGLDSSTVVAAVNRLLEDKAKETDSLGSIQKTFSAVFPGSANDEEKYIDSLLQKSKRIKDFKVYPKPDEFFSDLADFVKTQEEPTISTGPYAQYQVMRRAHEEVTVLLDGQGADEMMAGYMPYYFVYLRQMMSRKQYGKLVREVFASLDVLLKYGLRKIASPRGVSMSGLFNKEFAAEHTNETFRTENSNLKKRLIEDIFANSLQSLLRYEDRNAMRFSIEGRVPFLDFRLVRSIFELDDEAIIKEGWNKRILRDATADLLPSLINRRRNKIGFTTPEHEWFKKNGGRILAYFTGERFEAKRYVNQASVATAFKAFMEGKTDDTMLFWRILNLELWLREFMPVNKQEPAHPKRTDAKIHAGGRDFFRYPLKTDVFRKGDDFIKKIIGPVFEHKAVVIGREWFIVVSEKVIATSQGRAHFIWDIRPSVWARFLSRFVSRVPWGIGLGSPWTMELAIREAGLPRILFATLLSAVSRPFGIRGIFYRVAGRQAAGIDGPTEYSLYPANVSAKLLPRNPEKVCRDIDRAVRDTEGMPKGYLGSVIIDANDIGQNVLGSTVAMPGPVIESAFRDNPMGQTNEQTPVTVVAL